jgi:hypothetical protein
MPWKLVEVPDDDEGTLTDWELIGVKVSLETSAGVGQPGDPAASPFGRIWAKLRPHFAKAIENDRN